MSENIIPLNKLIAWSGNVRRTATGDGLDELAASIAAHGLLQSLVVRKTSRGRYAVVAGERRRQALVRLAETGRVEADLPVPCRVISGETNATEISLAENVVRVAMHPADQFEAFRTLIDGGATPTEVAARFGIAEITVVRRMRLGRVSPALLAAYRAGEMSLEQVQAFALSDDHAQQERVWEEVSASYSHSPHIIRSLLTSGEIPATDKRVRFVTLAAYETAGGTVRRDLFDDRSQGYVLDPTLLDRLVSEKLTEISAAVTEEGWKWSEIRCDFDWQDRQQFSQISAESLPFTDEEHKEFDRLNDEAEALYDTDDDDPASDSGDRLAAIEERLALLTDRPVSFSQEAMSTAGVVISLRPEGTILIERGLIRPEDRKQAAVTGDATAKPAGLPASLITDLSQQRTAILQAGLMQNTHVALAAVVYTLAVKTFCSSFGSSSLDVTLAPAYTPAARDTKAAEALQSERDRWGEQLPGKPDDLWRWCLEQADSRLIDLLAVCIAPAVNVIQGKSDHPETPRLQHGRCLAEALDIDTAAWFRPTAENYFGRLTKSAILEAIAEIRTQPNALAWMKLKKTELAAIAETFAAESTWLPEALRITLPVSSEAADAGLLKSAA